MTEVDLTHTEVLVKGDTNYANLDNLRIKKVNKTHHMLRGELVLYKEIGNEFQLICLSYKKAGNDYKLLPYKVGPQNFCEFIESEKLLYPEVLDVSDFPPLGTCPWPKGELKIHGYEPDLSKIPPVIDTGDYMVECKLLSDGEMVQGMKIFGSVLNMAPMGK